MPHHTQDLRSRAQSWSDEPETAWKPAPGDVLVGIIEDIDTRSTQYDPRVPVLLVRDEETGALTAVWAFHAVLRSELARTKPQRGERIAIRRLNDTPDGVKRYRVFVDRDRADAYDWSAVTLDGSDAPADRIRLQTGDAVRPPAPFPRAGEREEDDDLPF